MNRLDLVVGPNGAGKSTFVELTLAPLLPGSVFVNADEIARRRWPDDPAGARLRRRAGGGRHQSQADRGRPVLHRGDGVLAPVQARVDRCRPGRGLHRHPACSAHPGGARGSARQTPCQRGRPRCARRQDSRALPTALGPGRRRHPAVAIPPRSTTTARSKGPRIVAQFGGGFAIGLSAWPEWTPKELSTRW